MDLLGAAEDAMMFGDYDSALHMLTQAYQMAPQDLRVVEALGFFLAEMGRAPEAVTLLKRAVEMAPESGFEKYMYLGQLLEGAESIQAYQAGIAALERQLAGTAAGTPEHPMLCGQLCSALCALAEQHVTSAPDLAGVAAECEALLRKAHSLDASSPEPLQALASMKYELGSQEEALALLRDSIGRWHNKGGAGAGAGPSGGAQQDEEMAADDDDDDSAEWETEDDDEPEDGLPSFEFRFECAKLLIELDEKTDTAIEILERLVQENDMDPNVWHLLSLAYYSGGHFPEAQECCRHGEELLKKLRLAPTESVWGDYEDLKSAIADAYAKLGLTAEQQQDDAKKSKRRK